MSDALRIFNQGTHPEPPPKRFVRLRIAVFLFIVWPLLCLKWYVEEHGDRVIVLILFALFAFLAGRYL